MLILSRLQIRDFRSLRHIDSAINYRADQAVVALTLDVDGTILEVTRRKREVAPPPRHLHVGLIHPVPHRLMGEGEAAREKHLGDVAQAQLVLQTPRHDQHGDIGVYLQMVV